MIQNYEEMILKIKEQLNPDCVDTKIDFIRNMTKNYSEVLGFSEFEILKAIESKRKYCANNYYQPSKFPLLNEKVKVFNTVKDLFETIKSKKFICPACEQEQPDPYSCKSNYLVNGKICDWKSYGLLGTLDRGFRFTIKDTFLDSPMVDDCFLPVEFANTQYDPKADA